MSFLDKFRFKKSRLTSILAASALMLGGSVIGGEKSQPVKYEKKQSAKHSSIAEYPKRVDAYVMRYLFTFLHNQEGFVAHPYLDGFNVAIGCGLNVRDWKDFKELDFTDKNGKLLTPAQKLAYYKQILRDRQVILSNLKGKDIAQALHKQYNLAKFKMLFKYEATKPSLDRALKKRIDACMKSVKTKIGTEAYYNLPPEAQVAILDMEFNLGSSFMLSHIGKRKNIRSAYPKFKAAVMRCDFASMASECKRGGIGNRRNTAVQQLFLKCGQMRFPKYGTALKDFEQKKQAITRLASTTR